MIEDWMTQRFKEVRKEAHQAFWNTLQKELPPNAKITGVKVNEDGISVTEISHGLTKENFDRALAAMFKKRQDGTIEMMNDMTRVFFA